MSPRNRVSLLLSAALVISAPSRSCAPRPAGGSGVAVGYIFGAALILAGAGRGWLALKMERRD